MKSNHDPIIRLFSLVRENAARPVSAEPGHGFTTRVLARVRETLQEDPWVRLGWRSLPFAAVVALACLLVSELTSPGRKPLPEHQQIAKTILLNTLNP